ncbi:MAG: GtrA family protein [Streptococcaceae bacterium]|jgi:putative flippase GtrA|nr:GtrA family protein [Streptococcaceae bacterium]
MQKIKNFLNTEAFKYLVFGVLTTLVYYLFMNATLLLLKPITAPYISASVSEAIGQILSIIFAFFTNKKWVFEHQSTHVFLDFLNFAAGRLVFMVIAVIVKYFFGKTHPSLLALNVVSLILQIANILLNYFYSKFIVFRKTKKNHA